LQIRFKIPDKPLHEYLSIVYMVRHSENGRDR